MPFSLAQLTRCRPYLFHLTAASNLPLIERAGELRAAGVILVDTEQAGRSSERRHEHLEVSTKIGSMQLRDQKPLIEGAIAFEDGWDLPRFIQLINQYVFFWPGSQSGPIKRGINHFERYRAERPVILRFPTAALSETRLRFSRYNSGAPRCSGGRRSPRGGNTYLNAADFSGSASEVVEVVVPERCPLPTGTEVSDNPAGPWQRLPSTP
jgi:hypothetical protein